MKKYKLILAVLFSFIYHFLYIVDAWTDNIYLLEKKIPILGLILDGYLSLQRTTIGMFFYFHLYAVFSTTRDDLVVRTWLIISFLLVVLFVYYLLKFIIKPNK